MTTPASTSPLSVVQVYPSGDEIPENLLRVSVVFEAPVQRSLVEQVALLTDDGRIDAEAFYRQELWSPDQTVLTLLLHPGRVKTGLVAHERHGRPVETGPGVALLLEGRVVRRWEVAPEPWTLADPRTWGIGPVPAGTRDPLVVDLRSPIDALSRRKIAVADPRGERVPGRSELELGERTWRFTPDGPWERGDHALVVHPRLENPCGDQVGEGFEHPPEASLGASRSPLAVPFAVMSAPARPTPAPAAEVHAGVDVGEF